ncbi:hypothetical protein BHE74_00008348 [Ensete ventricosum]|nr:hypothetical protein BHE74_00008348 [Ensete ventricosum]
MTQWVLTESLPEVYRGLDDVVGSSPRTHQKFSGKFVGSSPIGCRELAGCLPEECWNFVRSSPKEIGSSLGVHRKDARMGPRREFDRRFTEGIGKLAGSTPGDHRKKSGSLIARMPEVTGLVEVGS